MKKHKKLILSEFNVVRDLRSFISSCSPEQLASVFGYVYGMHVKVVERKTPHLFLFECVPHVTKYTKHREKELVSCD